MNNIFNTPNKINIRYDLKGSTQGRTTKFPEGEARDETIALKDMDFLQTNKKFSVGRDYRERLVKIIELDAKFFGK